MRSVRLALLLGLTALALSGCHRGPAAPPAVPEAPPPQAPEAAPAPPPAVPEEGGEGTFALEEPFTGLAASKLATSSDRMLRGLAFHGLTRLDASGRIEPELAVRWEMLGGGSEWIFHLRPDTPFANGRYLEARHVVASWERLIADPAAQYSWLLDSLKGFAQVQSGESSHPAGLILEDGLTLRVVLERPVRDFLFRAAHPALGISAFGEDEQGIGPFEIWGTPRAEQIVVRSNPEYFRGLPHLDEIAFVRGEAARRGRMASGDLDAAVLEAGERPPSGGGVRTFTHSVPRSYLLGLNRSRLPFSRPETTRAFLASLDREAMTREISGEAGWVPATLVAALAPGRRVGPEERPGPTPSGLGRLDLLFPGGDGPAARLAAAIAEQLLRAGGKVVTHAVNPADFPGAVARKEYHLFVLPFVPSTPHLLLAYEEVMQWNRTIPGSLALQARALEGEEDPAGLAPALEPLDTSLQLGGYLFPLAAQPRRLLVRRGICGLRPDPAGLLEWTQVWASRTPGGDCD